MNNAKTPLRPGLTAIAAVLALSSTPLLAQNTDAAPAAAAPVMVTPPTISAPAIAAPQVTSESASPAMVTPPPPPIVIANDPAPEPIARTRSVTAPAPKAAPRVAAAAPSAAPRAVATETPAPAPTVVTPEPVAVAPTPAPVATAPAPVAAKTVTRTDTSDDMLPIAGAAGVAALVLAGGAFALSRRRRRDDEVVYDEQVAVAPVEPAYAGPAYAVPVMAATPVAATMMTDQGPEGVSSSGPVTEIPAGFDLSRFGRHTQAAYRGPTANNQSLSLKRRLKRASFFDQRERMAEAGHAVPKPTAPVAPAAAQAPTWTTQEHVTVRAPSRPRTSFRPAFQS